MMANRTMSLGPDIDFLRETLHAQQELLQKLYNELDVERESSATAADETLSMILRLQGEKAAMEMEASQYKRIAEEKMTHSQEMVETFQELIYQKEMQIASLEFQVQAYKFKLASLGCEELGNGDMQYPENMLSRRNGLVGETSSIRRGNSVPPLPNSASSRRASIEGLRAQSTSPKTLQEKLVEYSLKRSNTSQGDFSSYWEEIKKLDERVKEFDPNPPARTSSIHDPSPDNSPVKMVLPKYSEKVLSVQPCGASPSSPSVQDIFEVPQEKAELSLQKEIVNGKMDSVWDDVWKMNTKETVEWEKQPLLSQDSDLEKKPLLSPSSFNGNIEKQKILKQPVYGVADFELQQFNRRIKQLEDSRFLTRGRETSTEAGYEELKLLKEIMEKIEAVQSELTSWKTKKSPESDDRSFGCFKEVMCCFLP